MGHAVAMTDAPVPPATPADLAAALEATGYLADDGLATVAWLSMTMRRPRML